MSKPETVDDKNFDSVVISAKTPVLVDFWATWCSPCRMVAPIVDELAEEYTGKVSFAKVNVDENRKLSEKYEIRSIPTLLVFKDGKPVKQIVGLRSKGDLKKALDEALAAKK
ncbi:MAG: thioredoxin [Dehalococcoidia bacterium]|nr:thioredoxin [Dehalococcoidia bacterium]